MDGGGEEEGDAEAGSARTNFAVIMCSFAEYRAQCGSAARKWGEERGGKGDVDSQLWSSQQEIRVCGLLVDYWRCRLSDADRLWLLIPIADSEYCYFVD